MKSENIEKHRKICEKYCLVLDTIKNISKLKDSMTYENLSLCLKTYVNTLLFEEDMNSKLSKKKIRKSNFPSHISENIVKFCFFKKYNIMPNWDTDKGDLCIENFKGKTIFRLEVKGFISDGPSSFGPSEKWDRLYFVDAKDILNFNFKVYEIKLSNENTKFLSVKLNRKEDYGTIAKNNQRGKLRGCFYSIFKNQLEKECSLIFDGNISQLK